MSSKKYLTVYNLSHEKEWVLKNAFDIVETQEINTVYELEFSIPKNDQDMAHCQPYWFVRYGDDGQMYRFTEQVTTNANESTVTYHCEHVIATLSDDIMFQGPHFKGGRGHYTTEVLNFILDKQTVKNWVLGTCQPRRQFEYSWENENLLAALFSVPNCFATSYMWTYDTSSYPWKVNLVTINEDADPDFYLMAKKNILQSTESSSNLEICTRLYGLGEGEGVNQLTIKSVNNGLPYIQSSPEKIAEYGIVSRIFVDRRYQYPETLKARMEALLHELETPSMKREFSIVDLHDLAGDDMYKAEVGRICLLKDDNTKVYITKTVKNWTVAGDMKITIATKATDISTSIADLADRQRIEQVYSQGASQVYSFNFSGNATDAYPLNGYVYFPEDLKYLNEVKLKVKLDPFRSYSATTASADVIVESYDDLTVEVDTNPVELSGKQTTESGGGTTSSSGGTSVTVGGGATKADSSITSEKGVSVSVQAKGVSLAPQAATTSPPSTELTSGTTWEKEGDTPENSIWTGWTNNGAISFDIGKTLTGGTYSLYGGNDGYHSHDTEYWESGQIDGGNHSHKVSVDVPTETFEVINNSDLYGGYGGKYHHHVIGRYALAHSHNINHYHTVSVSGSGSGGSHSHTFSLPDHTHSISSHRHNLPDLSHKHNFTLKPHSHKITLKGHSHEINPGIFESGRPTRADLLIDGKKKATITQAETELDITELLLSNGKVPRGQWIQISIKPTNTTPNNLAYISVFGNVFAFIQSYTGGNF